MNLKSSSRKSPPRLTTATSKSAVSSIYSSPSFLPSTFVFFLSPFPPPLITLSMSSAFCPLSQSPQSSPLPTQDPGAGPGCSGWGWEYFGPWEGECHQSVSGPWGGDSQDQWTHQRGAGKQKDKDGSAIRDGKDGTCNYGFYFASCLTLLCFNCTRLPRDM